MACIAVTVAVARGQESPNAERQRQILHTVTEFAKGYLDRLPDFTCTRTTVHSWAKATTKEWNLQAKVASELSYYNREEHYRVVAVNDLPKTKVSIWTMAPGWVEASGSFGSIVREIFDPKIHADFQWKGWEYVKGKRAYVFSFRVPMAESSAVSSRCVNWIAFTNCKRLKHGYHGLLYVDQETLDIQRLTDVAEGLPSSYFQGDESFDYARVTVAGNEYLLPVADRFETTTGKTRFLNESSYGSYHKFVTESTLKAGLAPSPEGPPAKAAPKVVPREAERMNARDCFALRNEVGRTRASRMDRATVAAAFHDFGAAEKELLAIIAAPADPEEAIAANAQLAMVKRLSGHPAKALEYAVQSFAGAPDRRGRKAQLAMLEALARYPAQSVVARGFSRLSSTLQENGLAIAASVNGNVSQFVLDTGAGISSVSESQAKAIGIGVHEDRFPISDIAGTQISCRLGMADELHVGNFRLRNVAFCVRPDVRDVSTNLLGLPVLLAFETMRWSADGSFEIGLHPARKDFARSNVCFAGDNLSVEVALGQKHLAFDLDTGNDATFLYSAYAEDFASAGERATAKEIALEGIGGSTELRAAELPEMKFTLAGLDSVLHDVPMLVESTPLECPGCYGNIGRDILNPKARVVTLDFKAMKLTLQQ